MTLLPQSFYARDAVEVAPDLVGKLLRRDDLVLRITEVEAYPPGDTASHCRAGRTARNAAMWGPPGRVYVYLCYGLHQMLNLVTNPEGEGAAVLVRACEPVSGDATLLARRRPFSPEVAASAAVALPPALLTGPGKVGQALALDPTWSHHPLYEPGGLELLDAPPPPHGLLAGPRVGIDYASPAHRAAPWRFAAAGTPWITRPAGLRPFGRRRRPPSGGAPSP